MVLSLAFVLAFIGAAVALLIGIILFSEVEGALSQTFGTIEIPAINGTGFVTDNTVFFTCNVAQANDREINSVAIPSYAETFPLVTVTGIANANGCTGMAQDPTTGKSYVLMRRNSDPTDTALVEVNLSTGAGTLIGQFQTGMNSMAFNSAGELFTYSEAQSTPLRTIFFVNKTTASTISTCTNAAFDTASQHLVYDYDLEQMYFIGTNDVVNNDLNDVNPKTCALSNARTLVGGGLGSNFIGNNAKAYAYDTTTGLLWGAGSNTASYQIFTVDPSATPPIVTTVQATTSGSTQRGAMFNTAQDIIPAESIPQIPPEFAQASSIAFTVIGIIPVALFFFLFAIFGGRVE